MKEMKVPYIDKKQEAIKRMKMLRIFPETIKQFDKGELVSRSEPPFGACYWFEGNDLAAIREFEEQYNAMVYFGIRSFTEFGVMDSLLYVSDHPDEWEMDREDLKNGECYAYVRNLDAPELSEIGMIGIARTPAAGLRRTY